MPVNLAHPDKTLGDTSQLTSCLFFPESSRLSRNRLPLFQYYYALLLPWFSFLPDPTGEKNTVFFASYDFPLNQSQACWRFLSVFIASVGEVAPETHDLFMTYHKPNFFFLANFYWWDFCWGEILLFISSQPCFVHREETTAACFSHGKGISTLIFQNLQCIRWPIKIHS